MWLMIICVAVAGLIGGGYFVYVSALLGILLLAVTLYRIVWKKEITMAADWNLAAFAVLTFSYLIVSMWAVDTGVAVMGFIKFLPLLLFYIYVSGESEEARERMIQFLPAMGTVMTVLAFAAMQLGLLDRVVSVAGRLAGFFQYPNTYAVFMLICFIIVVYRFDITHPDWMDLLHMGIALFGIYMSGSRTVFILTALAMFWLGVSQKKVRKPLLIITAAGAVLIGIAALIGGGDAIERITSISLGASTFIGRILYAVDALPVILQHPFGLGYYGYYFIQQSIQSGVYSVVNVHNELLQFLLDVGVIPTALMCAALVRTVISKRTSARNRMALVLLLLHSLFDYDFQFLVIGFVLILLLDIREAKRYKAPVLTRSVLAAAGIGSAVFGIVCGASEFLYTQGKYEASLHIYGGNTLSEIRLLTEVETAEEMRQIAEDIISKNEYVSLAYSARARANLSEGKVRPFMEDKRNAIRLAPYQMEEYVDYLEVLYYCENLYLENGNIEDARICAAQAAEVPEMVEAVREKTHPLAWKIKDRPDLELDADALQMVQEMQAMIGR